MPLDRNLLHMQAAEQGDADKVGKKRKKGKGKGKEEEEEEGFGGERTSAERAAALREAGGPPAALHSQLQLPASGNSDRPFLFQAAQLLSIL